MLGDIWEYCGNREVSKLDIVGTECMQVKCNGIVKVT